MAEKFAKVASGELKRVIINNSSNAAQDLPDDFMAHKGGKLLFILNSLRLLDIKDPGQRAMTSILAILSDAHSSLGPMMLEQLIFGDCNINIKFFTTMNNGLDI